MTPFEEKSIFVNRVMEAIREVGYPCPDFYVDQHPDYGTAWLFDQYGSPIISIECDSPTAVIKDMARALDIVKW